MLLSVNVHPPFLPPLVFNPRYSIDGDVIAAADFRIRNGASKVLYSWNNGLNLPTRRRRHSLSSTRLYQQRGHPSNNTQSRENEDSKKRWLIL